jgi:hypothetical protein
MRDEIKSGKAEIRSMVNAWVTNMRGWSKRDNVLPSNGGGVSGQ